MWAALAAFLTAIIKWLVGEARKPDTVEESNAPKELSSRLRKRIDAARRGSVRD